MHVVYTTLLSVPAIGFFLSNQTVQSQAHFIVVIALILTTYLCYSYQSEKFSKVLKCLACLSSALLILFLSAEVSEILLSVYKISFGEELTFAIKMILMISNMEGNLDLCLDKEEKGKGESTAVI